VPVDDERLDPLWATAAELHLPVVIHIADPIAFFQPLDATNERYEELGANPDWHFWPTRAPGALDDPGFPPFDELLAGLDRLVGRHPATTFVGAHVGCAAEDLGLVSRMLDAHPNLFVDIAARVAELGRQPYSTRAFFLRHADRIVFGTDLPADPAMYRLHYRFLETWDESFDYSTDEAPGQGRWQVHGLGLPDDVLRAVYRDNARRALGLDPDPDPTIPEGTPGRLPR
jgi:predicted TIM-barrel fold metal-dependent hydrolase